MKTKHTNLFLLFAALLFSIGISAQKPFLQTESDVSTTAIFELNELMLDTDFREELAKQKIKGSYTYQITVKDKGLIASMLFLKKSDDADIKGQNYFNNLVRNHKFNFKVPKGKFYKFNYTFEIQ